MVFKKGQAPPPRKKKVVVVPVSKEVKAEAPPAQPAQAMPPIIKWRDEDPVVIKTEVGQKGPPAPPNKYAPPVIITPTPQKEEMKPEPVKQNDVPKLVKNEVLTPIEPIGVPGYPEVVKKALSSTIIPEKLKEEMKPVELKMEQKAGGLYWTTERLRSFIPKRG